MGFIIEKAFQQGGGILRDRGIHIESLAMIDSLDNCGSTSGINPYAMDTPNARTPSVLLYGIEERPR